MGSVERERHRTRSPERHRSKDAEREPRASHKERDPEKDAKRKCEREPSRERDPKRHRSRSRDRAKEREPAPKPDRDAPSRGDRGRERDRERSDRDREPDRKRDRERSDKERAERPSTREPARELARESARDAGREAAKDAGRDAGRDGGRDRERERGSRDEREGKDGRERRRDARPGDEHEEGEALPQAPPQAPPATGPANDNGKKPEVQSLEELLKKRQADALAASKPVFLSKKQREELALKKRANEVAARQAPPHTGVAAASGAGDLGAARRAERDAEGRRRDDDKRRRDEEREREKELAMIKAQYLGGEKKKKKVLKGAEKFKFNFDWEAADDTSRDLNPLYNQTHEASLLFGRGLRAGVDRREQKKTAAAHEAVLMRRVRESHGITETHEDRQRERNRQALADSYDQANNKVEKHWTDKTRDDMLERDWRIFREDHSISYKGSIDKTCLPIRNWKEANLPSSLMKAIAENKYEKPSPIQMAAIPLGLMNRDVIGIAETGSGKTAAFVLPMLVYIQQQPVMTEEIAAEGPYAVILAPTRELAQQIEVEAVKMAKFTDYRFVSVVGGQSIEEQGFKLRKGCEVIIGTPGRLVDCLQKSYAVLNQCNYVVMDEADRMIDLGFEPQVMGVLDAMSSSNLKPEDESEEQQNRVYRTTYMFSATMPQAVERLARKYLRRPVVITIGSAGKAVDRIVQRIVIVKDNEKGGMLSRELDEFRDERIIVFVNTKRNADTVSQLLHEKGYSSTVLHSGKSQDQREAGLAGFKDGTFSVLVATDVAGRGIDVQDVALVVNYDMPHTIENYTHRIGRTGRAGKKGVAVTLLTMGDTEVFYDLKQFLETNKTPVPPQLARHEAARIKPGGIDARPKRDQIQYSTK